MVMGMRPDQFHAPVDDHAGFTEPPILRIEEREVYANRFIRLFDDAVTFPGGNPGSYVRLAAASGHPGVVLLTVSDDRVALVYSYRYPVNAWQWGLPRGFGHSADPLESAAAELTEETGIRRARHMEILGHVTPDSGVQDSRVAVVLTHVDRNVALTDGIDPEISAIQWAPVVQVKQMVADGEIEDGFTLSAIAMAVCRGLI